MKFKTNYNRGQEYTNLSTGEILKVGWNDRIYELNEKPSMTVPGQSMTIREMLQRHAAGLPIEGAKVPLYEGDETMDDDELVGHPDLSKMDLADRQEYIEEQAIRLAKLQAKIDLARSYQKKKKAEQGEEVQRTSGEEGDQGQKDQPDNPNPKKTRGAGAEPRDTRKGDISQKGGENAG